MAKIPEQMRNEICSGIFVEFLQHLRKLSSIFKTIFGEFSKCAKVGTLRYAMGRLMSHIGAYFVTNRTFPSLTTVHMTVLAL